MMNRSALWFATLFLVLLPLEARARPAPGSGITKARAAKGSSKTFKLPRDVKLPPSTTKLPDMWMATSLGWDGVVVSAMNIHEALNGTAVATAQITAPHAPAKFLGQEATLAVRTSEGFRYFNGYITRVENDDKNITVTVETFMGRLSQTANPSVFENVSLPRAIYQVLDRHVMSSFRFKLLRRYERRAMVIQYRETDLNIVKRLVEDLGLLTSVSHTKRNHRVTFSDTQPRKQTLRLRAGVSEGDNSLSSWRIARKIPLTRYTLANHGHGEPSIATSESKSSVPLSALEIYDYEPSTTSAAELQFNAVLRVEESLSDAVVASGGTGDRRLRAGDVIKVEGHATDSGNYLVTESFASYHVFASGPISGQTSFSAIPAKTRYRPKRTTAWPLVSGLQRAQVVDIDPTKNRLRIRFPWDRAKSAKRKGSVWVSLISPMRAASFAKSTWVDIGFAEGDPSLPMVLAQRAAPAAASP